MKYRVVFSNRTAKDLDKLNRDTCERILRRLEQLSENPFDSRLSAPLHNAGDLRRSRVGGWRIILSVDQEASVLFVVTIERRGQVFQRI